MRTSEQACPNCHGVTSAAWEQIAPSVLDRRAVLHGDLSRWDPSALTATLWPLHTILDVMPLIRHGWFWSLPILYNPNDPSYPLGLAAAVEHLDAEQTPYIFATQADFKFGTVDHAEITTTIFMRLPYAPISGTVSCRDLPDLRFPVHVHQQCSADLQNELVFTPDYAQTIKTITQELSQETQCCYVCNSNFHNPFHLGYSISSHVRQAAAVLVDR